ncbi:MAG TPA: SDR family oxidoreductase [Pirellulales bacterium]|nr:SDR family oxidoreductase [Pirellulales bacterium]
MQQNSKPEVVVITGASAGVGRAAARAFGERGAQVGLIARGVDGLEAAKREIEMLGGQAVVAPADVASPEQVESACAKIEETFGNIDVWVNCAMTSVFSPFHKMNAEEFQRVIDVTLMGQVHGTMTALRRMLPRDRGTIVQVGSALAYRSIPLQSAYCAAKAAVRGFTDSLRTELLHLKSNVHLTMVQLPGLNTPQFGWVKSRLRHKAQPVPPIFQPEVAADAIVYAAHHRRREIWVGASSVKAILSAKLAPAVGDWVLSSEGYSGQQTSEPEDPGRPDNLWEPLPGDHGAHGTFDERASAFSPQLWLNKNRGWLTLAAGVAGVTWSVACAMKQRNSTNGVGRAMAALKKSTRDLTRTK